jgi:RNA polymerase sigma-70 factor (ECF subfamily)
MDNTDKSLIVAHCQGDKGAFGELIRRYGDAVFGYLVHMTNDREQAEDLFQETFKRVHEKAHTFRGENFKSWLFTIATHLVIDNVRRRKRQATISLDQSVECASGDCEPGVFVAAIDQSSDPLEQSVRAEQKQRVRQAIETLPVRQRAALVLAYYHQLSYSQVAQTMGCSIGTVKVQMSRALQRLARTLPEFGEVPE